MHYPVTIEGVGTFYDDGGRLKSTPIPKLWHLKQYSDLAINKSYGHPYDGIATLGLSSAAWVWVWHFLTLTWPYLPIVKQLR